MALVNDPSVSTDEALHASRHSSVTAQCLYMTLDRISEASRFKALGMRSKKGVMDRQRSNGFFYRECEISIHFL